MWLQSFKSNDHIFTLAEQMLPRYYCFNANNGQIASINSDSYWLTVFSDTITVEQVSSVLSLTQSEVCRFTTKRDGVLNSRLIQINLAKNTISESCVAWLEDNKLDYAITPDNIELNSIQLIVSDMDSTFIQQEVIDEIGEEAGIKSQIAKITERAMQGELDFSESLIERVGLLKGLDGQRLDRIFQRLELSPGIAKLVQDCRNFDVKVALVSGGFTYFVERFKQLLGLYRVRANLLQMDEIGRLTGKVDGTIVDAKEKRQALIEFREELKLLPSQVLAMGDGANDIDMLQVATLGVAFKAKPALSKVAHVHIKHKGMEQVSDLLGLAKD